VATPIRFGILGAARIAPAAIVKPARDVDGVEVAAVAARDRTKAEQFARKHKIPRVHESYDDLLADPEIDAIYNPLPNGLHGHYTIRAIEAGKHVLCEKPFTANAREARAVAAVAAAHPDRVVVEAFHWRYHPLATQLLDLVESGRLGPLVGVEASMLAPLPKRADIRWQLALAGGSLMDMGCYPISFVRVMTGGEPVVERATARLRSPGVDRFLTADLRVPRAGEPGGGAIAARITCGMWSWPGISIRARLTFTEGEVRVLNPFAPHYFCRVTTKGAPSVGIRAPRTPTYTYQLDAFRRAVVDGEPSPTGVHFAVANMAVIDACYEAADLAPRVPTTVP
jgi:predicted dehydrogenase